MSTYTTTLWEIMKDINGRIPQPIPDMIKKSRPIIFDFDYETPTSIDKDEFKEWFETTFLTKFALWNIGFDTYEQFHLQLWSKCNRVMPIYAIKIDALTELKNIKKNEFAQGKHGVENRKINSNGSNNGTSKTTDSTLHSTLPANMINADSLGKVSYADDGVKQERNNTNSNSSTNDTNEVTEYDISYGNVAQGMIQLVYALSDNDILNAFESIINEFNMLFLGVM